MVRNRHANGHPSSRVGSVTPPPIDIASRSPLHKRHTDSAKLHLSSIDEEEAVPSRPTLPLDCSATPCTHFTAVCSSRVLHFSTFQGRTAHSGVAEGSGEGRARVGFDVKNRYHEHISFRGFRCWLHGRIPLVTMKYTVLVC